MDGRSGVQPAAQRVIQPFARAQRTSAWPRGESRQEWCRCSSVDRAPWVYRALRSVAMFLEGLRLNPCSQWRATIPPFAWAQRTSAWPRGESRRERCRCSSVDRAAWVYRAVRSAGDVPLEGPLPNPALSVARNDSAMCLGAAEVGVATGTVTAGIVSMLFSRSGGVGISGCAIGGGAPRRSSAKSLLSVARNDSAICVDAADVGVATGRAAAGTVAMLFGGSGGVGISGCAIGGDVPRRSSASTPALSGAQRFRHLRGRSGRRRGHGESGGRNGVDALQ